MDFDLDDPLGSDDSFFDEPKGPSKKSVQAKASDKKSFENLFGLDKSAKDVPKADPDLGIGTAKSKHTVTFDESAGKTDDIAVPSQKSKDFLGLGEKDLDKQSAKKTDFLEELLSVRPKAAKPEKKISSLEDILKDSKVTTSKPPTPAKEIGKTPDMPSDFGLLTTASTRSRRPRRGSATGLDDPLGLLGGDDFHSGDFFAKDQKDSVSKSAEDVLSKTKSEGAMPDWLGGSLPALSKTNTSISSVTKSTENIPETPAVSKLTDKTGSNINTAVATVTHTRDADKETKIDDHLRPQQLNMEIQNTYSSLHQQESFLLLTLQMKKYEEMLLEIKNQQTGILGKQEKQLTTLLDEYVYKQQMVESNIRLQQERINNQIQMLVSSPLSQRIDSNTEEDSKDDNKLIRSLKQRHEEELFVIEESYKKQINLLEKSNEMLEEKLKNEINNIAQVLEEKRRGIKEKYEDEILYYKEKLKSLEEQHRDEIKLLKEHHNQVVEELKMDHATQIEYIKQMKQQENNLLGKSELYSQKIDTSIELLANNTRTLQGIEEKVVDNFDVLAIAREHSIQAKEK